MEDKETFICFTDGSSTVYKDEDNGLRYGGVGVYFPDHHEWHISKSFKGPEVTNQRMELTAVIYAVRKIIMYDPQASIVIRSDSMYTIKVATEWACKWKQNKWRRKVGNKYEEICNLDLVKTLYNLVQKHDVKFEHVRSHQKKPADENSDDWKIWFGNHEADRLATEAMSKTKTRVQPKKMKISI